jgi:hypothetical protein
MNYDELGDLREADWGALARDMPERPPDRRRPPAPTPASEERERTERRDRAERRAAAIKNVRDGETLDELAERLGLPVPVVKEAHEHLSRGRTMRPELEARLADPRRRAPRSEMVAALGGEEDVGEIAEAFAAEARGRVAPTDRGAPDVKPLTRTGEETLEYLGELAEADRQHVA